MSPLASCLVHGAYTDTDRDNYNNELAFTYQNTMDFIGLHYFNNPRDGAFWKLVEEKYDSTDSLYNYVNALKLTATHTHKKQYYPRANGLFHEWNWKLWAYATGIGTMTWDMNKEEALKHINMIKDEDGKVSYPGIENRKWSRR